MIINTDSQRFTWFHGTTNGYYEILPSSIAKHLLQLTCIPYFNGIPFVILDIFCYQVEGRFVFLYFLYIQILYVELQGWSCCSFVIGAKIVNYLWNTKLLFRKKSNILNEITLRAERCSAPCCAAESREVSSRQQGGEWRLAGKVLAVRMFIFSFAPTKIELIHSILERYINICPYFPPTLPLHCSYRPPTNPLLFCIFSTTSRVWYYRLASFYVRIIPEIL